MLRGFGGLGEGQGLGRRGDVRVSEGAGNDEEVPLATSKSD